jgi:gamma-glutamyltranspeptidase/glutathione hydrolase|tara:strand:+ start:8748 stop:10265 length:1518 start_codon:yes stop_codon:yes gene_type:complete
MRLIKKNIPLYLPKTRKLDGLRQWIARLLFLGLLPSLLLSACGGPSVPLGQIGNVEGDLGGAASDEPRATLVAEDILASGGTAADAATALYFTLAVTYPGAASLGGGGECIVYDTKTNKLENLQFFNQSPAAGGAIAIPGNIRGMAALQARYGRLEWSQLLAPAEQIAAFGEPLSRAQHMAMVVNRDQLILDYNIRDIFTDKDGNFVAEGTRLRQVRLAALLSALRSEGGASFYTGNWARTFVEDARIAGGDITVSDMVNYKPVWQDARSFRVDSNMVGLSTGRSGELFEALWKSLYDGKGILGVNVSIPEIEIARQTATLFSGVPDISPFISYGTTSFVTSDNQGGAVACVVGLGFPFGSGQMGEISGIVMAGNQGADMREFAASPMIMANITNKDVYYAGAASGGAVATVAAVSTALNVLAQGQALDPAIESPRLFTMGPQLPLLYESAMSADDVAALQSEFPAAVEVDRLASVNAIYCRDGKLFNCISRHDPRGYGLSLVGN